MDIKGEVGYSTGKIANEKIINSSKRKLRINLPLTSHHPITITRLVTVSVLLNLKEANMKMD